jgi:hypothetical protein
MGNLKPVRRPDAQSEGARGAPMRNSRLLDNGRADAASV